MGVHFLPHWLLLLYFLAQRVVGTQETAAELMKGYTEPHGVLGLRVLY